MTVGTDDHTAKDGSPPLDFNHSRQATVNHLVNLLLDTGSSFVRLSRNGPWLKQQPKGEGNKKSKVRWKHQ
jgi:hypothetical protein